MNHGKLDLLDGRFVREIGPYEVRLEWAVPVRTMDDGFVTLSEAAVLAALPAAGEEFDWAGARCVCVSVRREGGFVLRVEAADGAADLRLRCRALRWLAKELLGSPDAISFA